MGLRPTAGLSDPWLIMVAIPIPWLSWIITQGLLPLIYIFGRLGLVMRVIGLYGRAGYYQESVG